MKTPAFPRGLSLRSVAAITLLAAAARADLAAEISDPNAPTPQMRGLGVVTHYGRNANWDIDATFPLLKAMGAQWVRTGWSWHPVAIRWSN